MPISEAKAEIIKTSSIYQPQKHESVEPNLNNPSIKVPEESFAQEIPQDEDVTLFNVEIF